MQETFQKALNFVLESEGGYVNNPHDPGGATNQGVTQAVYSAWRSKNKLEPRAVKLISSQEVKAIYKLQYWDAVHGDDLPAGLDYCLFDFAVNSGPRRAVKFLQKALDVVPDGHYGLITEAALKKVSNISQLIDVIMSNRLDFLQTLPTWEHFGKGWTKRVAVVRERAKGLR